MEGHQLHFNNSLLTYRWRSSISGVYVQLLIIYIFFAKYEYEYEKFLHEK
jgi:hypothetical protein